MWPGRVIWSAARRTTTAPVRWIASRWLRFVRETQAEEWAKLEAHYTTAAEAEFFTQVEKALKQRGTLDVLRNGIKLVPGIRFALCAFRPGITSLATLRSLASTDGSTVFTCTYN